MRYVHIRAVGSSAWREINTDELTPSRVTELREQFETGIELDTGGYSLDDDHDLWDAVDMTRFSLEDLKNLGDLFSKDPEAAFIAYAEINVQPTEKLSVEDLKDWLSEHELSGPYNSETDAFRDYIESRFEIESFLLSYIAWDALKKEFFELSYTELPDGRVYLVVEKEN